jgi:hypothetical protein
MYAAQLATRHPAHAHAYGADPDTLARLNWLAAAEADAARRARLFRTPREESEMQMMLRPVAPAGAYKLFGLLLGTLPPAAIFFRLSLPFVNASSDWVALLFVPMLIICAAVGRLMGARLGRSMGEFERGGWTRTLLYTLAAALGWATVTGAAGGFLFFVIGSIFGVFAALAVAVPAFLVFASLHRLLARGGMIDARHLRPLAWGVPATVAALILSPYLLPY